MKKIYAIILLAFVFISRPIQAQLVTAKQYQAKADEAFAERNFNSALEYYLIILNDEPSRIDLLWNTAEAARETRHHNLAARYYDELAKTDSAKNYPMLTYRRALALKSLGNYDEAINLLKTVASGTQIAGLNGVSTSDIQAEIETCEWAKGIVSQPATYEVAHLDDKVNTVYADIAPIEVGNTLYYTSTYIKDEQSKPTTYIYSSDLQNKATPLSINSTTQGEYTAHYALNQSGNKLYYNICKISDNGTYRCEIYSREKGLDGTWKESVRLDTNTVNLKEFTASQPNIGFNNKTNQEVLFFVSDRTGGKGGLDIWYAPILEDGQTGEVQNLSEVNTSKDDITPFYYNDANMLFFSTEGYKSLGGFDIYHATRTNDGWATIQHAGAPVNTSYDDMYFSINNGHAYFVSNKKGGMCGFEDKDCICNDIYKYNIKVDLTAETFLAQTTEELKGCKLQLIDLETGETIGIKENFDGNDFAFPLSLNKRYRLVATKSGFQADTVDFDTRGIWTTTTINQKLDLLPGLNVNALVYDKISGKELNGVLLEIREDERLLVSQTLTGHSYAWNGAEFGKTYTIIASKTEYDKDTTYLTIDPLTNNARLEYTVKLYLTPFTGLPLTLYFDNDQPGPGKDSTTILYYGETYTKYYARQVEYLKYYTSSKDVLSANEYNAISAFFTDSIQYGHNKLMEFCALLERYLGAGHNMRLVMQGFASPLAKTDYNERLTKRRISSVINHILQYNNGSLAPYIGNGRLQIVKEPNGEILADKNVSDQEKDPRASIFSIGAMKERKVIIKDITTLGYGKTIGYDPKIELKGYVDFDQNGNPVAKTAVGNLDDEIAVNTKATPKGVGANIPSSYSTTGKKAGAGVKGLPQKYEVVLIDALTGEIITKQADVEVVKKNEGQEKIGKGSRKGTAYRYDLITGNDYIIKGNVQGYNEAAESHYALSTEGGVVRDTLVLTPFAGMPLPLFFNNDHPNPNTKSATTKLDYEDTYNDFYGNREDFIKKYNYYLETKGSIPSVEHEMEVFFENEVKVGYDRLVGYTGIMRNYLKRGYGIEILLEGFASPLANADYNERLTARRVKSVLNYLAFYKRGALKKYLDNGQLRITLVPSGESKAATDVSDDAGNPQLSIYSLGASRERKVIIQDIKIHKNKALIKDF
jgi:hypothetical protein